MTISRNVRRMRRFGTLVANAISRTAPDGRGSAAELAEALALPVLLVIDAARSAQSAAIRELAATT